MSEFGDGGGFESGFDSVEADVGSGQFGGGTEFDIDTNVESIADESLAADIDNEIEIQDSIGEVAVADVVELDSNGFDTDLGEVTVADTVDLDTNDTGSDIGEIAVADAVEIDESNSTADIGEINTDSDFLIKEQLDVALPEDAGYLQGDNEYGLDGTCGIATVAGNLNEVTGAEISENDALGFAIENDITQDGATTQLDAIEMYEDLAEQTPEAGNIDIEMVSLDANNIDDVNSALQDGAVLDASVDSGVLWGEKDNFEQIDHAIGIDEPVMNDTGEVIGYNIRDTGSGRDFATTEELAEAGVFDNDQILISKKD